MLFLLLFAEPARAQLSGRVSIVGEGGAYFPWLALTHNRRFGAKVGGLGGIQLDYGITDYLGVQFGLTYTQQQAKTSSATFNTLTIEDLDVALRWNILTDVVQPYLLLGGNYAILSLDPPLGDESDPGVTAGAGVELLMTDHFSFGFAGRYEKLFSRQFTRAEAVDVLGTLAYTF